MGLTDKLAENWERHSAELAAALAPALADGERLTGVVQATEARLFSATLWAVGVTPSRLVLVPVDRRWRAKGEAVSIDRAAIESAAIWGWGGSVADFLSASADRELRFTANGRKWKLMVLGGNLLEDALSGPTQRAGLEALLDFLRSARPRS